MKANVGMIDRVGRVVLAALLLYAALGTEVAGSGVLFWLAVAGAAVFLLTALLGVCPLYGLVGVNTCKLRK